MCWLADLPGDLGKEGRSLLADSIENCWSRARRGFEKNDANEALRAFIDYIGGKGSFNKLPPKVRKRVVRNFREYEALVMSDNRYPALNRNSVRGLKVPTLLLYGGNTHRSAQLVGKEMRRLVPEELGVWVSVPNATHALWLQKPAECRKAVLDFLDGK